MRKKIKSLIVVFGMLMMCAGLLNAQGLYEKKQGNERDNSSSSSSQRLSFEEEPIHKGKGDEDPPQPGSVGDALWLMLLASGAYGLYQYRKNRYCTKA